MRICIAAAVVWFSLGVGLASDSFPLSDAEQTVADDAKRLIDELATIVYERNEHRWIEAMMELSALGPAAIPHVDAALQEADTESSKRRLLLVLRTFEDVRAVPAVIKYFPRLYEKTGSDMGYLADDPPEEILSWLIKYCDGYRDQGGLRYDYGRPINEAAATLKALTGKQFGLGEIRFMGATGDTLRDNAVRAVFYAKAEQWADWWNEHAPELTDDERYHHVELPPLIVDEGPSPLDAGADVTVVSRRSNIIVTPIDAEGDYGKCFLDLDTGRGFDGRDRWQGEPREEMIAWAKSEGFDLMAVEREDDGATKYALVPLAAKFWRVAAEDARKIETYLGKQNQIVLGETGDLLLDYDAKTKTYGDDRQPAFLYETEFGCVGVIFVKADVTELFSTDANGRVTNGGPVDSTPATRGFSYGVKISHHAIGVERDD